MQVQRPKIDIGYRVGMLTVAERTMKTKSRYSVWRCVCDCGGEVELDTRCLQRGTVTDCGCQKRVKPGISDLTGKRYGMLICLRTDPANVPGAPVKWICRCDCGNVCSVSATQLKNGNRKSCGCLGRPPLKDYVGKRFGMLTVTGYAGKRSGKHYWKALCDCGKETEVCQSSLQNGKTRSCGCLNPVKNRDAQSNEQLGFVEGTYVSALVSRLEKPPISSNNSGVNGVYRTKRGKWTAQITFKKKTYYLGTFDTLEEAAAARKRGEEMYEDFLDWYRETYSKEKEIQQA